MRRKTFKLIIFAVLFWHFIYSAVFPVAVFAQEVSPSPTPTVDVSPAPSDTPTDTPTATPTASPDATLTTGSSGATAGSGTVSNVSDITTTPTPTPVPSDSPTPEATDSASLIATPTPTPADITVGQSGTTSSNTSSSADTGNNSQTASGSAVTITGNATGISNSITVSNLSAVDANFIATVQNILTSGGSSIDLYQLLQAAIAANPNAVPRNTNLTVNQNADTSSNTSAGANTGGNAQNAQTATMSTGGAVALANAITAANLNLVGSNTMVAIINILSDWNGNIILPNGTQLSMSQLNQGNVNVNANQLAGVSSNTSAGASTGDNSQAGGLTYLNTGNAVSGANSGTIANIVQIGNGLGFLIINNLGTWNGNLINWSAPGSSQTLGAGSFNLATVYGTPGSEVTGGGTTNINSNQLALVESNVSAGATTGGNSQSAWKAGMTTGDATSFANNFTLANFTGVGGGLFFGIINILGNWTGNVITAYPELNVRVTDNLDSVNPGGEENYTLTLTNSGHAIARGVNLNFNFPSQVLPDPSQLTSWNLGNLGPGQSFTFNLKGHVAGDVAGGTQLLASANAGTSDTQDSTSGNTGSDTTDVIIPPDPPTDTRTPDLHVEVWDNVGAFVYPGDTVLAKITVYNNSPFPAKNVEVKGSVVDDNGTANIPLYWSLGNLKVNGKAKISFNINIKPDSPGGYYHLKAEASGISDSGDTATSNVATTDFLVKAETRTAGLPGLTYFGGTTGGGPGIPQVLGTSEVSPAPFNIASLFPYVLPMLIGMYVFVLLGRRKLRGEPLVSPAFADFFKKRKIAIAGSLVIVLAAISIFIRKNL